MFEIEINQKYVFGSFVKAFVTLTQIPGIDVHYAQGY